MFLGHGAQNAGPRNHDRRPFPATSKWRRAPVRSRTSHHAADAKAMAAGGTQRRLTPGRMTPPSPLIGVAQPGRRHSECGARVAVGPGRCDGLHRGSHSGWAEGRWDDGVSAGRGGRWIGFQPGGRGRGGAPRTVSAACPGLAVGAVRVAPPQFRHRPPVRSDHGGEHRRVVRGTCAAAKPGAVGLRRGVARGRCVLLHDGPRSVCPRHRPPRPW